MGSRIMLMAVMTTTITIKKRKIETLLPLLPLLQYLLNPLLD